MRTWLAGGGPLSPEEIHAMGWIWEKHKPVFSAGSGHSQHSREPQHRERGIKEEKKEE